MPVFIIDEPDLNRLIDESDLHRKGKTAGISQFHTRRLGRLASKRESRPLDLPRHHRRRPDAWFVIGVLFSVLWFIDSSSASSSYGTLNLARPGETFDDIEHRHVADSVRRLSKPSHPIVLVINPADGSQTITEAIRSGASVYALPRRKSSLPLDAGKIVPWRRAIDLTPILFALRPSNHLEWREQYRQRGGTSVARGVANVAESRLPLSETRVARAS